MSYHKTYLCDWEEREEEKKDRDRTKCLLGRCLFMLRLGSSEPFTPPLVLWITPTLDSMPLAANERKARKNSNVPLKAHSVALGSLPVPLLLYLDELDHGENSSAASCCQVKCFPLPGVTPVRFCVKY